MYGIRRYRVREREGLGMDHMPLESSSPPPLVPRAHLTEYGRKSASLPSLLLDPEAEVTTLPHMVRGRF